MGATAASVGVAVRTLMIFLFCLMVAALVYVVAIGALASFFDFGARWAIALLTDFTINVIVIGAWFFYKESSWIKTLIFIVLMFAVGSLATCGYILIQFHKLSPEEFSEDPLYFVLVRHQNRDVAQQTHGPSVVTARVIFSGLGCLMLGVLIYTIVIDLSPSHDKSFAPCLPTYLTDIYIHAVVLSVWIAYKEASWISAFLWIL
ncbi:reverse transcriptase, RNA-dependent DNA polymerase, partial [Tanacetum coccineum]